MDAVKRWVSSISESWALILDHADDPRLDIRWGVLSPSDKESTCVEITSTVVLSIPRTFETGDYQFRKFLMPHIDACLSCRYNGLFPLRDIGKHFQRMISEFALTYSDVG